jgi:hypothetical protein
MSKDIDTSKKSNEYFYLHKWLRQTYGRASYCSNNESHIRNRYHWANISGAYRWDIRDFKQLCTSCHKRMDMTDEIRKKAALNAQNNRNRSVPTNQYTKDGVFIKRWPSGRVAALTLGIDYSTLNNNVVGRYKSAGGYIWKRA